MTGVQTCALPIFVVGGVLLAIYALSMILAPPAGDRAIVPLEVRAE